jgi:hypothetical protein
MRNAHPTPVSEFKFVCPVCGQHIKCESWRSNTVMECPTCFQKITVPQAPETDDPKFIITGTKVIKRSRSTPPVDSGAATPPARSSLLPGIAVGILLCALVAAAFAFRGIIFKSAPAGTNAGNDISASGSSSVPAPGKLAGTVFGYRIDSNEVVFVFEPAVFGVQIATNARVHVAGDFNQWLDANAGALRNPAPAWQMRRVADDRYELHRQLTDFNGQPQWQFKFVVNLNQWIDVPNTALNRTASEPVNLTLSIPDTPGAPPR